MDDSLLDATDKQRLERIYARQESIMDDIAQIKDDLHSHTKDDRLALETIYDKLNSFKEQAAEQTGKIKGVGMVLAIVIPLATSALVGVIVYIAGHIK